MKRLTLVLTIALFVTAPALAAQQSKDETLPEGMALKNALQWAQVRWNMTIVPDITVDVDMKLPADVRISRDDTFVPGLLKILPPQYRFEFIESAAAVVVRSIDIKVGDQVGNNPASPRVPTLAEPTVQRQIPPPEATMRVSPLKRAAYASALLNVGIVDEGATAELMAQFPDVFNDNGAMSGSPNVLAMQEAIYYMHRTREAARNMYYSDYAYPRPMPAVYDPGLAYGYGSSGYYQSFMPWMNGCLAGPSGYIKFKYLGDGRERHLWYIYLNGEVVGTIDQGDSWHNKIPVCASGTLVTIKKLGVGTWEERYSIRPGTLTEIGVGDFLPLKRDPN